MKKREKNDQTISEVMNQYIKAFDREGRIPKLRIIEAWQTEMGNTINNNTKNIYIKNQKLYVHILAAPLKQEILMNKSKVIKMLNDKAGERVILDLIIL